MKRETVEQLLELNRVFYMTFAQPFAASRPVDDPALTRILPHIPQRARVLDVGCGNGRLARLLDRKRPAATYVGFDAIPELIQVAKEAAASLSNVSAEFHVIDVTDPTWPRAFVGQSFSRAVALALFHHIPSFDLRARVLRQMADQTAPGGAVLLSAWQFMISPRLRGKIVDWAEVGLDETALEPDDYLLDWKRGGRGLRYCHYLDAAELERLAAAAELRVEETFRGGGKRGDLSLFGVLRRPGA